MIPGIVSSFRRGSAPPTDSHRFWRLLISAVDGGAAVSFAELQFRSEAGIPQGSTGGTAFASSEFDSTYGPEKAFDGNGSTLWASSGMPPQSIGYQHVVAREVNQVALTSRPDGGTYGQTPAAFAVQHSDDGSVWVTDWSVAGSTGWSAAETRLFTRP